MSLVIDSTLKRIIQEVQNEVYKKHKRFLSDDTILKILWSQSIGMKDAIANKQNKIRADGIGIFKIKIGREASLITKREIAVLGLEGDEAKEYVSKAKQEYHKNPKEFVRRKNDLPFIDFDSDNSLRGEEQ